MFALIVLGTWCFIADSTQFQIICDVCRRSVRDFFNGRLSFVTVASHDQDLLHQQTEQCVIFRFNEFQRHSEFTWIRNLIPQLFAISVHGESKLCEICITPRRGWLSTTNRNKTISNRRHALLFTIRKPARDGFPFMKFARINRRARTKPVTGSFSSDLSKRRRQAVRTKLFSSSDCQALCGRPRGKFYSFITRTYV